MICTYRTIPYTEMWPYRVLDPHLTTLPTLSWGLLMVCMIPLTSWMKGNKSWTPLGKTVLEASSCASYCTSFNHTEPCCVSCSNQAFFVQERSSFRMEGFWVHCITRTQSTWREWSEKSNDEHTFGFVCAVPSLCMGDYEQNTWFHRIDLNAGWKVWKHTSSHFVSLFMSPTALLLTYRATAATCGSWRLHTLPSTSAAIFPMSCTNYVPIMLTLPVRTPELAAI